ncbi:flavodoxin family protein [Cellulomonas fimi]|uniref:Flavodoxin-like domain-containing protein n=1 Tax=Cellulomonas fimi (strain ATCC 484 / DSM 20113 / JCM 1341 / CCUG 24087 / LMG 16345 / NBRC 15513 / NCIMB 8980 / NCTC 7547 / NRS-133) TaxID=590998 RepID=F4GYG0_CELFA|nr:hypothetical protein [Cellulomonas fimi]AEE45949.1 hypothetical protein Celf_1819 [Cellulomonas fimi ATCC 484]NNH06535.1 flavodoxin [Cellulomonas fimi]VEH31089.1 Uncharacterised protein [Cellulomonas fimi]
MDAVVVVESWFGCTRQVADAVAQGLASAGVPTDVVDVGDAPPAFAAGTVLLVVGAPTHAFGMSTRSTRADAARRPGAVATATGRGVREWVASLQDAAGLRVATFDTRVRHPRLPGSAAAAAARALGRRGAVPLLRPQSFWVDDTAGPLLDGETHRAHAWGRSLAAALRDS